LTAGVDLTAAGATDVSVDASLDVVPEPSTVFLVGAGLVVLPLRRRYRRSA
jgi:hypothetical protein